MNKSQQRPSTSGPGLSAVVKSLVGICAILAASSLVCANDDEDWIKDSLTGDHQKQQFLAGERVQVSNANVADDIFAAGQDLEFESVSAKLIIAAGASLSLQNVTADDLILAGGEIDLSGKVKDDVVAAVCPFCPVGGRLHLKSSMLIGDDARLAGREIIVDGRVGGDLYAAAQHFELSGGIVGNAKIEAERIVLESGARIGGDLRYAGPKEPELRDGAVVAGQIIKVESTIPFEKEVPEHPAWYGVFAVLGFLMALVLLGTVLQLAVPEVLSRAATTVRSGLWASLGRGLVLALLGPAAIALLMVTVVGAPIGLVSLAALFLLYALAFVTIAFCVGLYVRRLFGKSDDVTGAWPRILWTAAGMLVLIVIGLVPFIGWAIGILAIIAGLGAVVSQLGPVFRNN
jgi:cytoskeletal protein CcmA (bactofilin family)